MTEGIRVLYVDDEPDLLELGSLFLRETGDFSVTTSESAEAALGFPDLAAYDAIISDYQMPGMDGIDFLKEVRQRLGNLPFILFTGRGREEVVIEAINNGADFYLQKGGEPRAQFAELTHKVRQAVARRKSESEITSIFQAVPVGIGVVMDRVLLRVNDSLCVITGYPRGELEGRNTRFLYLNDEDYAAVGRMREQAYRDGAPADLEIPWRRKDGTVIIVRITAAAVDRSNPLAPMTYSALDITREKQTLDDLRAAYEQITAAEEELRGQYEELARSETEIAAILRAAPVGIGLVSSDRIFLRVNERFCAITGYSRENLIGHNTRLLYPDDDEYARAGTLSPLGSGDASSTPIRTRFRQKDGAIRAISLLRSPIDPGRPEAGNIFIALDMTEDNPGERVPENPPA